MAFHCPRCSEFVAQDSSGCLRCGADFAALNWKPVPSPEEPRTPPPIKTGRAGAALILLLLFVPVLLLLIGAMSLLAGIFSGGGPIILLLCILLLLALFGIGWAIKQLV